MAGRKKKQYFVFVLFLISFLLTFSTYFTLFGF